MATDTEKQVETSGPDELIDDIAAMLDVKVEKPAVEPAKESAEEAADAAEDSADEPAEDAGKEEEKSEDEPEETAGEDEDKGDDEEKSEEEPEPTKVQGRIDKLTAQKHELAEQLEAAKAELEAAKAQAEAKPPVVHLDPENPLSSFTDAAALEAEIAKSQAVLDWTDDHRDGATVMVNGEEKHFDPEAIKTIRANARAIVQAAPKQREYLEIRSQILPEAKATYPEFFKPGTTSHQLLQATLKQYPYLAKMPNVELVIGDAFEGQRLRLARLEQLQKRKVAPKPASVPAKAAAAVKAPAKPSASPKVAGSETAMRHKADAVFKADGEARTDAIEQLMESIV